MQFAVKRLTRSDLTLFDVQFRRQNAGNQKSINLNRNVFVDVLFPSAASEAGGAATQFRLELRILGPGGERVPRVVARKVIAAGGRQKNWRLNGETVHADPDAHNPTRYDDLAEGDIAVFGFDGAVVPDAVTLVLLRRDHPVDREVHADLDAFLGPRSMLSISVGDLRAIAERASGDHPIRELVDDELDTALEDAAMGSPTAVRKLRMRVTRRNTHEALAKARAAVERIGRDGEVLVDAFLKGQAAAGRIHDHIWHAETNATHPHDFTVQRTSVDTLPVEVKSTNGPHGRAMIFSAAEIEFAAANDDLEVWRVSDMAEGKAVVRTSKALPEFARRLTALLASMPAGAEPNGWTVSPPALGPWSAPFEITSDDDPSE